MKKPESKLQELVTRLQQACGENLLSVVLYGLGDEATHEFGPFLLIGLDALM